MRIPALALTLALLTAVPALAASPWSGTWSFDPTKSKLTGETFTYSQAANGKLHFSDGGPVAYDFGLDGKPYPTISNHTIAWTKTSDTTFTRVSTAGGTTTTSHLTLSPDGKTLTSEYSGKKPDGSPFSGKGTLTRVGSGEGLVGTWQVSNVADSTPDSVVITDRDNGGFTMKIPGWQTNVDSPLDGTDAPLTGPDVPAGVTMAIKKVSDTELDYTVKLAGKPVSVGVMTLAADGSSYTDVSSSPAKPNEKTSAVYNKQ